MLNRDLPRFIAQKKELCHLVGRKSYDFLENLYFFGISCIV